MATSGLTHNTQQANRAGESWWIPGGSAPRCGLETLADAFLEFRSPVAVVDLDGAHAVATGGCTARGIAPPYSNHAHRLLAEAHPLHPEQFGDPNFRAAHRVRYAYIAGEMANGIASAELVIAMANAGMLGFFGAAGLTPDLVAKAIDKVQLAVRDLPYGFNLIHSPHEPLIEDAVARMYAERGVRRVCAAAFLDLTLPLVRYRCAGIHAGPDGAPVAPNHVFAKVSRVEVARKFLSPPPDAMLAELVREGSLTDDQARIAKQIPVAAEITAEADSGGHTDNRPAIALLPSMLALRDEVQKKYGYAAEPRVGLAGGISTPESAAAAFAMGAAYVLTGSINQACVEAGTSPLVKEMLAKAGQADVIMAPAADMFEMGIKVQVLKRGTLFAMRARKLYDWYTQYGSEYELPAEVRTVLERDYFRTSVELAWTETETFFRERDPSQIRRAAAEPKHRMALLFRKYLGQSSSWSVSGEPSRQADFQIWCGPSMGAFNQWVRGSCLDAPANRTVAAVALNILAGASVQTRASILRLQGIPVPGDACRFVPRPAAELEAMLAA